MEFLFINQHIQKGSHVKHFYMNKANHLSTSMVALSIDVKNDNFHIRKDDEEILGSEVSYLSAIDTMMYLANCTRFDIAFRSTY